MGNFGNLENGAESDRILKVSKLITSEALGRTQILGRKLLLTPELREQFVTAIADVHYVSVASNICGIHPATAMRWMKLGETHEIKNHPGLDDCDSKCEEDSTAFRTFFTEVKRAQGNSTSKELKKISNAGNQQWQASAWKLERTQPELFGMKNRTEITGKDGGPVLHRVLSNDQKQRLIDSAKETLLLEENDEGVFEEIDE